MNNAAITLYKKRRSQYALGKTLPLGLDQVTHLIQEAIRETPSSFNSQSARALILLGQPSVQFWNITREILREIVPSTDFSSTDQKINSFAAGAGTVLFFVDTDVIAQQQAQFPLYADNFPIWGEQANAMAQFAVWLALAEANIGASLQHYNPLVDKAVRQEWAIPAHWALRAQMPFGSHEAGFTAKTYRDPSQQFRVVSG